MDEQLSKLLLQNCSDTPIDYILRYGNGKTTQAIMVYPTDITYAGGKYHVHLVPEIRHSLHADCVSHTQRINYSIHRLSETQVQYLDGNFWATTRSEWYYLMILFDELIKFN